jgi:hypothetical protein
LFVLTDASDRYYFHEVSNAENRKNYGQRSGKNTPLNLMEKTSMLMAAGGVGTG